MIIFIMRCQYWCLMRLTSSQEKHSILYEEQWRNTVHHAALYCAATALQRSPKQFVLVVWMYELTPQRKKRLVLSGYPYTARNKYFQLIASSSYWILEQTHRMLMYTNLPRVLMDSLKMIFCISYLSCYIYFPLSFVFSFLLPAWW